MDGFTHLHLHTQYSLLDGAIRIDALPEALAQRGFSSCAITDHGNLFGAVEFHHTLKKKGIKPIIGVEAYVAEGSRNQRTYDRPGANASHLVLLCQNRKGYENLIQLVSRAYAEGKYYGFPRMDTELFEQYNEGLIALSACMSGVLSNPLKRGEDDKAKELARTYAQIFEGRFYVEVQNHQMDDEVALNKKLIALAAEQNLPLVGTNDCHYLNPEEAYPHYLLQLMGWQKKVTDSGIYPYTDKQLYLKTPEEMAQALADFPPEAMENTVLIAEQCDLDLTQTKVFLPQFEIPPAFTEESWFKKEATEGLEARFQVLEPLYGVEPEGVEAFRKPYYDRLNFELDVINGMRYPGYFLIVADFINWAKNNDVRVGPGRGSGAGSLVAYSLRITDLDPLYHGLLFERFLNPERVSLPDFDVDFDVKGRERVITYVKEKYGADKVCQIATFGSLGAKAALRGVARVLDFPYSEADKIAKLIPNEIGIKLDEAIRKEPALARMERDGTENEKKLIENGKALEGLNSNLSTHAAGVIIMDTPIQDVMPTCTPTQGDGVQSMYSMKYAEDQGAVKFDFLGLLNLTIIEDTLKLIENKPNVDALPLDDPETFALLCRGETTGVFQLESGGMRRLLVDLKPETFEDIVALLALYRPGPLQSGMVKDFVQRKNGLEETRYMHPLLESVLKETYGVMVYQEQVIKAAQVLAGYSLGEADILRRAIGKKIKEEMAQQRNKFVEGCNKNNIPPQKAEFIFDQIDYFSGYGFNKSHSAAYALIAYQTAYLKAHHPVEFMAALLSSDMDNTDKVVNFIAECRDMDIQVLPPDISKSGNTFTIEEDAMRFGLSAVKNVGDNAVKVILEARQALKENKFSSLEDFVKTVDLHRVNKRVMEFLIKSGGFDSLEPNRAKMLEGLEHIFTLGLGYKNEQVEGQETLFDLLSEEETDKVALKVELPDTRELTARQRLKQEKEALGFYISGHPLEGYASELGNLAVPSHELREGEYPNEAEVFIAGVVSQMTIRMTRKNDKFAIIRLEDLRGSVEVAVFPRVYAEAMELLKEDEPLLIKGKVRVNEDEVSVSADRVMSLPEYRAEKARELVVELKKPLSEETWKNLKGALAKHPGECEVRFQITTQEGDKVMVHSGVSICPHRGLSEELDEILADIPFHFEYPKEPKSAKRPTNSYRPRPNGSEGFSNQHNQAFGA